MTDAIHLLDTCASVVIVRRYGETEEEEEEFYVEYEE